MPQSYYVDPDYWIAGYAQGDIFDASAFITAQLSVTAEALLLRSVSSSITSALNVSALAVRVQNTAASIIAAANISANIAAIKEVSAQILSALSISALLLRLQHTSASFAFSAIVTANARFLKCNLQRNWSYCHDYDLDQHFFELVEVPLGIYNNDYINFALGSDWFSDNYIDFSNK